MKITISVSLLLLVFFTGLVLTQDSITYNLKDGTTINGVLIEETADYLLINTSFGEVKIEKSNLVQKEYQITLKSVEKLLGSKSTETGEFIKFNTSIGELTISKDDIVEIQEVVAQKQQQIYYPRNRGLLDYVFGSGPIDKTTEFSLGEEQLTDLFFDPTGYTFDKSTLYLSGLSFGFGVTDNFQVTAKWWEFIGGDMNIRPKLQIFEFGNWESQTSLSVGAHYHSRWSPNKYEWASGEFEWKNYEGHYDNSGDWVVDGFTTQTKYWGGFYPVGSDLIIEDDTARGDFEAYIDSKEVMGEIFGALTYSHAREGMRGRISHTIGGNVQYVPKLETLLYRGYYGIDVDINPKLKMIGEVFYDPFYFEFWQKMEYQVYEYDNDFSDVPVPVEQEDVNPVHLDFGFMYAFNESFRFGIHFQQPWIAFYWKF
ncbi:MAG: hypothetical protein H8E71_09395 [Candidatus Marinimicrobia bacterium]|nr:hypothetical protein [Candidatus Neomarinimicrobiota bacterium]MBL7108907.1 hypothetical protein [Candidatus Neomarinimicrobiota bacterium]